MNWNVWNFILIYFFGNVLVVGKNEVFGQKISSPPNADDFYERRRKDDSGAAPDEPRRSNRRQDRTRSQTRLKMRDRKANRVLEASKKLRNRPPPKNSPLLEEGPTAAFGSSLKAKEPGWLTNNITSIWYTLNQIQRDMKQLRRMLRTSQSGRRTVRPSSPGLGHPEVPGQAVTTTQETCEEGFDERRSSCLGEGGLLCGGNGRCSCGMCVCESPFYGMRCQCNDLACTGSGGFPCGGPGRGECRCGSCVCRPQWTGSDCGCSLGTNGCAAGKDRQDLCGGRGECVCNRCHCDEGFHGPFCEESIYSASICERLKPCVLCSAYGRRYPQCEECNIELEIVDRLESSRATCLMVNLGCILKYAYVQPTESDDAKTIVLVEKDSTCT